MIDNVDMEDDASSTPVKVDSESWITEPVPMHQPDTHSDLIPGENPFPSITFQSSPDAAPYHFPGENDIQSSAASDHDAAEHDAVDHLPTKAKAPQLDLDLNGELIQAEPVDMTDGNIGATSGGITEMRDSSAASVGDIPDRGESVDTAPFNEYTKGALLLSGDISVLEPATSSGDGADLEFVAEGDIIGEHGPPFSADNSADRPRGDEVILDMPPFLDPFLTPVQPLMDLLSRLEPPGDLDVDLRSTFGAQPSTFDSLLTQSGIRNHRGIIRDAVMAKDYTLLFILCHSSRREDINERDNLGRTPLHLALMNADVKALQILFSPPVSRAAVEVDFPDVTLDFNRLSCFHLPLAAAGWAQRSPSVVICLVLLKAYASLAVAASSEGAMPVKDPFVAFFLRVCGWSDDSMINSRRARTWTAMCDFFGAREDFESHISLDASDGWGGTTLHRAAELGNAPVARALLILGCDPWRQEHDGTLPIHRAIDSRDPDTFEVFLSQRQDQDPQQLAWSAVSLLRRCISRGAWRCLSLLMTDPIYSQFPISEKAVESLLRRAEKQGYATEFSEAFTMAVDETKVPVDGTYRVIHDSRSTKESPSHRDAEGTDAEGTESLTTESGLQDEGSAATTTHEPPMVSVERVPFAVFTHPDCLTNHLPLPDPVNSVLKFRQYKIALRYPENPTRLHSLLSRETGLLTTDLFRHIQVIDQVSPVALADVLRVHEWCYIDRVIAAVKRASAEIDSDAVLSLDVDTPLTAGSWDTALKAAGAAIAAVSAVCTGSLRRAFCAIRPPGHHVGAWGAAQPSIPAPAPAPPTPAPPVNVSAPGTSEESTVSSSQGDHSMPSETHTAASNPNANIGPPQPPSWINQSLEDMANGTQGFCLLNNVAIAAAHARYSFSASRGIRRIAIIDFDVHHGNGTEQIVRNLKPRKRSLELAGTHPSGMSFSMNATVPFLKCWYSEQDAEETFFGSIHGYGGEFYPGSGPSTEFDPLSGTTDRNIVNVCVPRGGSRDDFRVLFNERLLQPLAAFRPDLIIVSAGFDAHNFDDSVNEGFGALSEFDFFWITRALVGIANDYAEGRIVSILEGGYNTRGGVLSPFARSVGYHIRALAESPLTMSSGIVLPPENRFDAASHDASLRSNDDEMAYEEDCLLVNSPSPVIDLRHAVPRISAPLLDDPAADKVIREKRRTDSKTEDGEKIELSTDDGEEQLRPKRRRRLAALKALGYIEQQNQKRQLAASDTAIVVEEEQATSENLYNREATDNVILPTEQEAMIASDLVALPAVPSEQNLMFAQPLPPDLVHNLAIRAEELDLSTETPEDSHTS